MQDAEKDIRRELALAYRILAMLGMDDLTYTHLSARVPGASQAFLIYPFGQLFEEVTPQSLLKVNFQGDILAGTESQYNKTGHAMHGAIYQHRPDIKAVFHLHTISSVAVSAMPCGLLPISQFSFHFYNRLAYYPYDSLLLDKNRQANAFITALGNHKVMLMHNHGSLTCGETLQEAFFYMYYLEQACRVQCQAMACSQQLLQPVPDICEKAAQDMRNFEPNLGARDWKALVRKAERYYPDFARYFS
jgi:ribulose-5-phosphate 4-epimerase/fuculose-1-phosphate aldolase